MRRRVITALLFAASASAVWLRAAPEPAASQRTVYLIGEGVAEADIVAVSAALAGGGKPGVLLLDSPRAEAVVKPFLARYRPDRVVAVGNFPGGIDAVEQRWGVSRAVVSGIDPEPADYARSLAGGTERVVVCPAAPAGLLLQAACLAGALPAPLFVVRGAERPPELEAFVTKHKPTEIIAVGAAAAACRGLPGVTALADEAAAARAHRRRLREAGPISALVLANPADAARLSALAPWVALSHRAALVLTDPTGADAA